MIYYVSAAASCKGNGSKEMPFQTISHAAAVARPGDEVIVAPGIYREYDNPAFGGVDDDHRITYRSEVPLGAVITGAEQVANWERYEGSVWKACISNGIFGSYNPYITVIKGDWYHAVHPVHTGEVYLNGKSLYEVFSLDDVKNPVKTGAPGRRMILFTNGIQSRTMILPLFMRTFRSIFRMRRM